MKRDCNKQAEQHARGVLIPKLDLLTILNVFKIGELFNPVAATQFLFCVIVRLKTLPERGELFVGSDLNRYAHYDYFLRAKNRIITIAMASRTPRAMNSGK